MFPSSGYFRGINCPFYVSGLCERPNCHYRHSRVEEKPKSENGPSYSTSIKPYQPASAQFSSSPLLQTNTSRQKDVASYSASTKIDTTGSLEAHQASASKENQVTSAITCPIPSFSETPQILPEPDELPLQRDLLPKISGLPKPKNKSQGSSDLPSYIPTPKRVQLIVKGAIPSYKPTPIHGESRPKKNSSHTVEYDPVKNFSFRDKATSDTENDDHIDSKEILTNESQKQEVSSLPGEDDEAASANDSDNKDSKKKEESPNESDLTDSDEDVTEKYIGKSNADEKLPHYAELLTPSSYFTNKLNSSLDRKLSSDSDVNSPVKPSEILQNKSSVSNNISHKHNRSKHHHSHRHSNLGHSHLSSKSSSSLEKNSKAFVKLASSSSEKKISSRSKHSEKTHRSSSASSSSSPQSARKHSHTNKVSTSALQETKDKSVFHSSRDAKIQGDSVAKKENRPKPSSVSLSSSSSQKKSSSSTSSSSKNESKSCESGKSEKTQVKSKDVPNGHSVHKRKHEDQTTEKPSKQKAPDLKHHKNDLTVLSKEITQQNGTTVQKHSNNHCNHKSDNQRRRSLTGSNTDNIRQDRKNVHEKGRLDVKGSVRRNSESSVQEHTNSHGRAESNKINTARKESSENCKSVTNSHGRAESNKINTIRKDSSENCKSVTERRISDITSNLFGGESEESDSDVQIIDVHIKASRPSHKPCESDQEIADDSSVIMYSTDDVDLLSDSDTFDECLRIFKETEKRLASKSAKSQISVNPDTAKLQEEPKVAETSENLLLSVTKKRMAHKMANEVTRPLKKTTFRPRLSPAEVMHNRIVEMQKRALLRAARREGRESELPSKLVSNAMSSENKGTTKPNLAGSAILSQSSSSLSEAASSLIVTQKKREAHTPKVKTPTKAAPTSSGSIWSPNSFYNKKKGEPSAAADSVAEKKLVTIASTASKAEKRIAHEPTQSFLKRPVIPAEFGTKVPSNIRQRYLNLMIDEYLKFMPEESAFDKGQAEEQAAYNRASNKNIYLRVAVNAIKKIRTEAMESQPSTSKKQCPGLVSLSATASTLHPAQSHEATLGGSLAAKTSYTLHRSGNTIRKLPEVFSGKELYDHLKKYILTEEQLRQNGFPRPAEDGSNKVRFFKEEEKDKMLKDNERTCKRCGKRFYVDKEGGCISLEQCIYHYANPYKKKVAGSIDSRYGCCNERIGSKGCQVAKCHVHEKNKTDSLTGYMRTLPASPSSEHSYGVYALDCEMVYTKIGLELARVTVIGEDCKVKYESLVKPDSEIIDYNTRFSGITEKDMRGVVTTLRGVQAVMLSMVSDKTILIGHSLESDLQALKLIHSTVVDTSIVFPHRLGLPYKRALRSLMVDHLQKIIQADDGGHDSKEDAVACMQLMLYKVKTDAKRRF